MAGTMSVEGLAELGKMFEQLGDQADQVAGASLYEGAAVAADALNGAVDGIQTENFKYAGGGGQRLPSPQEKAALQRKVGIAKFRKNGTEVDTVIGFGRSGYTQIAGKPKAVAVIARSINSGTSFMRKQPVFRKAARGCKAAAEAAILKKADKMINEITGGN